MNKLRDAYSSTALIFFVLILGAAGGFAAAAVIRFAAYLVLTSSTCN